MKIYVSTWIKLLERLLHVSCPESRLIANFLAREIEQECASQIAAHKAGKRRRAFSSTWWTGGFSAYASAIGLDPDQLIRMGHDFITASTRPVLVSGVPVVFDGKAVSGLGSSDIREIRTAIRAVVVPARSRSVDHHVVAAA